MKSLIEIQNERGLVSALEAIGEKNLASAVAKAEKTINDVLKKEGIKPYNDRPESTKRKLSNANAVIETGNDLVWKLRRLIVE